MPLAFEAALFAGEMIFPDMEANDWHGPKSVEIQKELIEKRLGKAGLERYRLYLKTKEPIHFIPIGIHKFWHHHEMDFVLDPHFHQQCPYLKFIIPKNIIPMQFTSTAKELGIGIPRMNMYNRFLTLILRNQDNVEIVAKERRQRRY